MTATRILYIEDEPDMVEIVKVMLARKGYEVTGACCGLTSVQAVEDMLPDLILLDLMMPEMDGWEVYQRIKSNPDTRNIPVIVMTARAQSIDRQLGLRVAGVDDYIVKPFGAVQLVNSIEKVLAEHNNSNQNGASGQSL
jgi:CheY-like chemotaxis protein